MTTVNKFGILTISILAAIVATICDAFHVYTKTLSYPDPLFFHQAWWVFPGFFIAFLFMAITYVQLKAILPPNISKQSCSKGSNQDLVETLTTFAIVYILSGFGNFDPSMLCIIFYSTFVLRLLFSYERIWLIIIAILLAVGGMFFEGLLAEFGLVKYRYTDIFNVPYWLGGLYMHGAFALRAGMRRFVFN